LAKFLEEDLEVGTALWFFERVDGLVNDLGFFGGAGEFPGDEGFDFRDGGSLKMVKEALVAFFENGDFALEVFQSVGDVLLVFLGVDREGRFEVVGETDVVDEETATFIFGDAVYAGDGLKEVVLAEFFIEIHDLLDRRIEAGEEHVADDEEGDAGVLLVVVGGALAVAQELLLGGVEWVCGIVIVNLGFDDDEGDAVYEEDDGGDDYRLDPVGGVDAELVDGSEGVALGVVEVDESDDGIVLVGDFTAIDLRFEEEFLNFFVRV
jgi:hypothetical protein